MKVKNSFWIVVISLFALTACDQLSKLINNEAEELVKSRDSALNASDDLEEIVQSFNKIIRTYRNTKDKEVLALTFETMVGKAGLLSVLAEQKAATASMQVSAIRQRVITANTDAIAFHDQFLKTLEGIKPQLVEENLALAYYTNALQYAALDNKKKSITTYQLIIEKFADSSNESVLDTLARSLNNNGVMFNDLARHQEAIDLYSELLKRFKDTENEELKTIVTTAIYNKGLSLQNLNKYEEAILFYNQVIERTQGVENNEAQESLMQALYRKSVILKKQGNEAEAEKLMKEGEKIYNNLLNKNYI